MRYDPPELRKRTLFFLDIYPLLTPYSVSLAIISGPTLREGSQPSREVIRNLLHLVN